MSGALAGYALRRLLSSVVLVAAVSASAFVLVRLAPGDATTELALSHAGADSVAAARARLGLDQPIAVQLAQWLRGLTHLDLGQSSRFDRPVSELVVERAANTARLALLALVLALMIGLPVGVLTGASPQGATARCVTPISIALLSCPPIIGAFGLMLLAIHTGWLSVSPGAMWVPALALSLPLAATLERVQAQATSDALASPVFAAGAARGLSPARLLWLHAGRQSLRPVLGIFGILVGGLFSGSLAVEWITSWPGIGRLMYDAVVSRDLFLVAGCALFGGVLVAAGNLLADLLRAAVDPRVRLT